MADGGAHTGCTAARRTAPCGCGARRRDALRLALAGAAVVAGCDGGGVPVDLVSDE
ncbi:MAG: hypothetical protein GVY33_15695, partial [Alphaproteobacteria bacterium]|nr:hypothetical protein [Alphaproteobacteria bacterium]